MLVVVSLVTSIPMIRNGEYVKSIIYLLDLV